MNPLDHKTTGPNLKQKHPPLEDPDSTFEALHNSKYFGYKT